MRLGGGYRGLAVWFHRHSFNFLGEDFQDSMNECFHEVVYQEGERGGETNPLRGY